MQIYNNPFDNKTNRNNVRSNQALAKGLQSLSKNNSANNVKQAVSTLIKGQVIKGLVLDVSNKQVVLEMENGEKLNATVKEAVDLNIGEQLYFEVKDESSGQIQLRPLTDPNINPQNATLEKVLNSNGLMLNEKNLSIVSELMDQGMNLDDATIRTIIRNSTKFPEASIKSLVLMEKLQLPANETTISQLNEYEEGNGMILKQTEDFINQFCEELQSCKDRKGFGEVSRKLTMMMKEEITSAAKELEVLQKINQVIEDKNAGVIKDSQVLQKINEIIQDEYSGQLEGTKGETVVFDKGSVIQNEKLSIQEDRTSIQQDVNVSSDNASVKMSDTSTVLNEESVIQRGLQSNRTEELGIIAETKGGQILEKINQIIQNEYPEAMDAPKSETVIQKAIKESQTENLQTINMKMTLEAKDAQALQKITQIIQKEYFGEIKDAKGESVTEKNLHTNKADNLQMAAATKEGQILEKINQVIQDEFGGNVEKSKGDSVVQKGQTEISSQSSQTGNIQMSSETKEIQVIQKIKQIIKEEYLEEVKETNDETLPQKETKLRQSQNSKQNETIASGTKDAEYMQKTAKVVQEESVAKNTELMTKISKVLQEENLGLLKEAKILQKLTEAVRNVEIQSNQSEPIKITPLTIKLNQFVSKENPVQTKESQMLQKFEQAIKNENLGVAKESQLMQKLTQVVKNQLSDTVQNSTVNLTQNKDINMTQVQSESVSQSQDTNIPQNQSANQIQRQDMNAIQNQTMDVIQAENTDTSKEAQLIQKINQFIQIETESMGVVQESNVDSMIQSIKQMINEASIEGNLSLNEIGMNQNIGEEGKILNVSEERKTSVLFEEFDASKIIKQNSSKTVEFVLSNAGTFEEALDSFLNIANHPLLKEQINQESLKQITDIYASNLPKEEMLSQIEQVLTKEVTSDTTAFGNNVDAMLQESPKQTAQKFVEFMDQMDLLKNLPQESAQRPALNSGFLSNKTLSQASNLNQSQNLNNNGTTNQNQNLNQNGNSNQNQTLNLSASGLPAKLESELSSLRDFLQSKDFNDIVKGALQERWYAEPEDLKDDFKVKEQIRKIGNDLNQISQLFEKEGGFQKSAELSNQIKDNIDFMNQVNQYYNYVQIPLKLTEQLTNSELYVYTNKKNLKNNDGQISVLLHLDMKNLGSTDIHVALTNQSIHTRFYLEEEDSLQILENHISELEIAIQKLGYTMSYEMNVRQQMPSFSENLLEEKPKTDIKRYNFDVRM
ncbi:MAG: flagellar hook-length control protein FliK [Lachnospiraceae bacterium]|nr:flagellar hook-length control protein FliK [Lachnospiraceae bacterium]